ncbi:MAG: D-glycerate dehydrogenase, partial [Deltaproteobacteria bacterium]|nr:D-glycerate dehydrogenase [Deltaproteobacteria bacterium]
MVSSARPRVLVTRRLPGDAIERLAREADVDLWPEALPPPRAEIASRIRACDGIVSLLTDPMDAAMMDCAPRLRVISNCATGVDNIDLAAAAERGIRVGHTPGVLTETTADLAFALMLAAARRVVEADAVARDGRWKTWDPSMLLGVDLHGATLAVVGFGAIGRAVARRAAGFAMDVLYVRRGTEPVLDAPGRRVGLEEALRRADFVSLHVPLSDETRGLIGARELAWTKPTAVLVNTSRG